MKRLGAIVLLSILSVGCFVPVAAYARTNSQARSERKAEKKQRKAQKKYAKAQRKAQNKMIKKDRKNSKMFSHPR